MSAESNEEVSEAIRCASCGTIENDDVKLKRCNGCYLVRYCGVKCQKEHRPKHKKECKKRAAELRDELLFKQTESTHEGDCPICLIPIPLDAGKRSLTPCCSKFICNGCDYSYQTRQANERLESTCPFCRQPTPKSVVEAERVLMKRVRAKDPAALQQVGSQRNHDGDYEGAFEYFAKAATLGDAIAHYHLSWLYNEGKGVEKDKKKELYHMEEAAIGGFPEARYNLGAMEWNNGRKERAIKHYIIAAKLGHDESLEKVKEAYQDGLVSKDDFASTLRAHKAAVDAMKSPSREAADADAHYCRFRQNAINRCGV